MRNIGDDAATVAVAGLCRRLGFEEVEFTGPGGSLRPVEDAGLVVVGGGGLLYDEDAANVGNYTAPLRFAAECGVPAAVLGVGTQGIRSPFARAAYGHALRLARLVTVRDPEDAVVLREQCGVDDVAVTADLAFTLPELDSRWLPSPERPGASAARPLALVSLGKTLDAATGEAGFLRRTMTELVGALAATHEVVLAQHSIDDEKTYAAVEAETGARRLALAELGVRAALEIYASAELVVTSRYHGVVFAALGGAPVVPVVPVRSRFDKTARLIAQGLPSLSPATIRLAEGERPRLAAAALATEARIASRDEVSALRAAASRNLDLLASALLDPPTRAALVRALRPREDSPPESPGGAFATADVAVSDRSGRVTLAHPEPENRSGLAGLDPVPPPIRVSREKHQRRRSLPRPVGELCNRVLGEGAVALDIGPSGGRDADLSIGRATVVSLDLRAEGCSGACSVLIREGDATRSERIALTAGASVLAVISTWMDAGGLGQAALIRIAEPDPALLVEAVRNFGSATILVEDWEELRPSEDEIRTLGVQIALSDLGIFEVRGEDFVQVPIFALGKTPGPLVLSQRASALGTQF